MNDIKISKDSFLTSNKYKKSFEKILAKNQFMLLIICNDLAIRIQHIELLCNTYNEFRNEYDNCNENDKLNISMISKDFIIVEDIIYHSRRTIDQMIYALWISKVGISNIDNKKCIQLIQ